MGDIAKGYNIHVELALLALQGAMSEIRFIEENEINNSGFRDRLPVLLNELKKAIYYLSNLKNPASQTAGFGQLEMNDYRIRVRDQEGAISDHEKKAVSLSLAVQGLDEQSEVVKVERIDPLSKEVLNEFYNEVGSSK